MSFKIHRKKNAVQIQEKYSLLNVREKQSIQFAKQKKTKMVKYNQLYFDCTGKKNRIGDRKFQGFKADVSRFI